MMAKKADNFVLALIGLFLGIFIITQYYSGKNITRVSQPENNEILALEVAKLTKANADLRVEVKDLTNNLSTYRSSTESHKTAYDQYLNDVERFDVINGLKATSGQGVLIRVEGNLITPQLVDLINAVKNIGAELIQVNGTRLSLNSDLSNFSGLDHYEIVVLGNSKLIKSAMERKGGIIEQIKTKELNIYVEEKEDIGISSGKTINFNYAKIIER